MKLNRSIPPAIRPFEHIGIPFPERISLKNGIPLNILQVGNEDVVRMDFIIKGGQWHQSQPLQALFTNRMLREGSSLYTSAQIAEKLDFYGAVLDLSSSVNCAFITLYSLSRHLDSVLPVVADMLMHPTYPEDELELVRRTNKQRYLVNSTRVEVMSRKAFNKAMFGTAHPLGNAVLPDDYERIGLDALRTFYRRHYHSGGCTIYLSGKVTPEILRCVEQHFGNEPWGEVSTPEPLPVFHLEKTTQKRHFVAHPDALQSSLKMGAFVMDRMHPDFLKARVMTTLFGGYFGSRLMSNIREDKGYTYGIGAGIVSYPDSNLLVISTEAANEYVEAIISEVYHEIDRLCTDLVPQSELEQVKNYMIGDWCRSYEGPFSLPELWIYIETGGLDERFFERSIDAIRSINSEEIRTLAQKYLCKEDIIEVVAGKKM